MCKKIFFALVIPSMYELRETLQDEERCRYYFIKIMI